MSSKWIDSLQRGKTLLFPKSQAFETVWGGSRLISQCGKPFDEAKKIGESWELSDVSGNPSIFEAEGQTYSFRDIFKKCRKEILGPKNPHTGDFFPLLYKFIDASQLLSVQVHPGENDRQGDAKTEAWYILEAPPQANIIVGLEATGSEDQIFSQLISSNAPKVLRQQPVQAGDTFLITPGTVHAITAGLLVYEIQQNSNTTYRLYDWDRVDAEGKSRTLHHQESREVLDFRQGGEYKRQTLSQEREECLYTALVATPYFVLEKWSNFRKPLQLKAPHGGFQVYTNIGSACTLSIENSSWLLEKGQTVLVPAAVASLHIQPQNEETTLLRSWMPHKYPQELLSSLLPAGFSQKEILQLGTVFS